MCREMHFKSKKCEEMHLNRDNCIENCYFGQFLVYGCKFCINRPLTFAKLAIIKMTIFPQNVNFEYRPRGYCWHFNLYMQEKYHFRLPEPEKCLDS